MPRGVLIVFEGPEGAGKSTQLRLLADWLGQRGHAVIAVREPGGTIVGDQIRRILLDPASDIVPRTEALLFMASRAQLVEREIRPALDAGSIVLVDRFFLSTYAYQGDGRGLPETDLRASNAVATSGLVTDRTLLLALAPHHGLADLENGLFPLLDVLHELDCGSVAFAHVIANFFGSAVIPIQHLAVLAVETKLRLLAPMKSNWVSLLGIR